MNAYKLVIPQTPPVRTARAGSGYVAHVVLVEVVTESSLGEAEALHAALQARAVILADPQEVIDLLATTGDETHV